MTCPEVATQARDLYPTLKVLFTTGYARNAIFHQGRRDKGVQLITKPFSFDSRPFNQDSRRIRRAECGSLAKLTLGPLDVKPSKKRTNDAFGFRHRDNGMFA